MNLLSENRYHQPTLKQALDLQASATSVERTLQNFLESVSRVCQASLGLTNRGSPAPNLSYLGECAPKLHTQGRQHRL
jgi:hypothetical protein